MGCYLRCTPASVKILRREGEPQGTGSHCRSLCEACLFVHLRLLFPYFDLLSGYAASCSVPTNNNCGFCPGWAIRTCGFVFSTCSPQIHLPGSFGVPRGLRQPRLLSVFCTTHFLIPVSVANSSRVMDGKSMTSLTSASYWFSIDSRLSMILKSPVSSM